MEQEKGTWHNLPVEQVIRDLKTDAHEGLRAREGARRLASYGTNELRERPRPGLWQMFLAQFDSFVIWILMAASLISALLGDYVEAAAIVAIVILNALIGVIHQGKAEEALAALKKMIEQRLDSCPIAKLSRCPMRLRSQWIILVSGHRPADELTMVEIEQDGGSWLIM